MTDHSSPVTTQLIGAADLLRDQIAERIWRAEYRRATDKERAIEWAEVGDADVHKYLYLAEAILQLPSLQPATPTGGEPAAWLVESPAGKEAFLYEPNANHTAEVQRGIVKPLYINPEPSQCSADSAIPQNVEVAIRRMRTLADSALGSLYEVECQREMRNACILLEEAYRAPFADIGEPAAWTNGHQLSYLRHPGYAEVPMAMWAKPSDAADIPLYRHPAQSSWRPIETAPKDGTRVLVYLKDPLPVKDRQDLDHWHGIPFIARHNGVCEDGFDIGWQFAAPVGCGGFPDAWMAGWQPIPPLSSTHSNTAAEMHASGRTKAGNDIGGI